MRLVCLRSGPLPLLQPLFLNRGGLSLWVMIKNHGALKVEGCEGLRAPMIWGAADWSSFGFSYTKGEGLAPFLVGLGDDGRRLHGRVLVERVLDLDRGDVLAARDDDVLRAVLELDVAVRDA